MIILPSGNVDVNVNIDVNCLQLHGARTAFGTYGNCAHHGRRRTCRQQQSPHAAQQRIMQRVCTALLVLATAVPAAAAGLDAADLGATLSLRRGLRSADQLLQAASNIFKGTVPKKNFQKACTGNSMRLSLAVALCMLRTEQPGGLALTSHCCLPTERVRQWHRYQAAQGRSRRKARRPQPG